MSRIAFLAAALIAGFSALPAAAQSESTPSSGVFKTAEEIYSLCSSDKAEDEEACDWYVMAAHDMMKYYGDTSMGGAKICLPVGIKALAVRDTVLAYWREDPSSRKYSAVSTIYNALSGKYPCED